MLNSHNALRHANVFEVITSVAFFILSTAGLKESKSALMSHFYYLFNVTRQKVYFSVVPHFAL